MNRGIMTETVEGSIEILFNTKSPQELIDFIEGKTSTCDFKLTIEKEGNKVKWIASTNDDSFYWEVISPYELFKYLVDVECVYQMNKAEAFGFVKNLMKHLNEPINLDRILVAYESEKEEEK